MPYNGKFMAQLLSASEELCLAPLDCLLVLDLLDFLLDFFWCLWL